MLMSLDSAARGSKATLPCIQMGACFSFCILLFSQRFFSFQLVSGIPADAAFVLTPPKRCQFNGISGWQLRKKILSPATSSISPVTSKAGRNKNDALHEQVENDAKPTKDGKDVAIAETTGYGEPTLNYPGRMPVLTDHRCGFCVVMGAPNMGKSTLVNALLEEDLCIATRRPQTTRHAILGLLSKNDTQVCLVDTPGILESPAYKLQEGMMEAVVGAFHDADVLLIVTDLFSTPIPDDLLFAKVRRSKKPIIVCINKIDLADKVNVTALRENMQSGDPAVVASSVQKTVSVEEAVSLWRLLLPQALAILPVTASKGPTDPGVNALRTLLLGGPSLPAALRNLGRPVAGMFTGDKKWITDDEAMNLFPPGPPLYDQDILTDRPERFIASEIIRAALFELLKKELPYCCQVQIEEFKESNRNSFEEKERINTSANKDIIRIKANIVVERDSQKIIVVGKKGSQIKEVGILAREKLEEFFQTKIYLKLNVKVDKDWRKKEKSLKDYGYMK